MKTRCILNEQLLYEVMEHRVFISLNLTSDVAFVKFCL